MTLPKWNDDWEKPDPLKGKGGWTLPDYITIALVISFGVISVGLMFSCVEIDKRAADCTDALNWLREQELGGKVTR